MKTIGTNMEWIECNLPWSVTDYSDAPPRPEYPVFDDKVRAIFGKTTEEFQAEAFGDDFLESLTWKAYREVEDGISKELNSHNLPYQEEVLEKKNMLESSRDPNVKMVLAYRKHKRQVDDWYETQPEVIAVSQAHSKAYKEWSERNNQKSFSGKGLAVSGTLIEVMVNDKVEQHLIGTINESSGVCNDCTAFQNTDIVLRYKVVYSNE